MKKIVVFILFSVIISGFITVGGIKESFADHDKYRHVDGSGNHPSSLGMTEDQLVRKDGLSDYSDGASSPAGPDRNSAREISNAVFSQSSSLPDPSGTTDTFWLWGQFIDHDIDLTVGANPSESFDIPVPTGDNPFDLLSTGTKVISMGRSNFDASTGTSDPRQQINSITSFIDASNIYGSDQTRADQLRDPINKGKLTMELYGGAGWLLPENTVGEENANANPFIDDEDLFLAGDIRANEQAALTAMHTLFAREHNRIVDELIIAHPGWNSDKLYQEAKMIVEGELQWITYEEFLPILLGNNFKPIPWTDYNPLIDPRIANEFSTAAYRYGHDAISSTVERKNADGSDFGELTLLEAFFNPNPIKDNGIDEILRGVSTAPAEKIDHKLVNELRNLLFGPPPDSPGTDLAALDIQRGRDHGLIDYNAARVAYGLPAVNDFSDITSDPALQATLSSQYDDVDDIDLWVGGLSEDLANGSMLGPLFSTILQDQFERTRDGDKYFYLARADRGELTPEQLNLIENSYLSDIIMRNTVIDSMQDNVFLMPAPKSVIVGGEMIPVDRTALLLAGMESLSVWTIPVFISLIVFSYIWFKKGSTSAKFQFSRN